ncbi:mediator of RNA polymerase II transcription subunit 12 isoform X1 [Tribolium castaneum]|uniref:mediator of RNA polymerase II transcription subunit 12 isoform X1 n=1 Tax=Tribolium castaneum TaxID=7070 RepID=UPI00046C3720|nr:PREDICTED: mediator of RNA polymerase II transcription subunit 12 isoform X1 [Tribolium castaneum]|eukprot:XP_008193999.1 PREDICTED: mediator of RNA polymerase II transcription subunit 12 isoform X1 [Tribolium castaneum]
MFNSSLLYEKRPLKKPKIGPPDVYPQEPKQKEDELTSVNVKHGFLTMTHLSDEFGTARNCNISASKVGDYFNDIIKRKEELSMLPDSGRKRQQINPKDNFWPATIRTKNAIELWFKDLAGNKPLMHLSKKAPNFNKKEEIFIMLCEYQVPMMRAAWFIKLSSAYTVAVSEAKIKKRQMPDPTTEWTGTMLKFLKEQILKLQDYYSQGEKPPQTPSLTQAATTETEQKLAMRHWIYCTQLLKYMYEEGLMDRQEVLTWILELLEKMRSQPSDDGILRLLMPLCLQYLDEFVQSELLSRRLAHLCCKKLGYMLNNVAENNLITSPQSETKTEQKDNEKEKKDVPVTNPMQSTLMEYQNCPHHRDIVLQLSTVIQTITLECPTALVWCGTGVGSVWHGSPLDLLPMVPSSLPMAARCDMNTYRKQLQFAEHCIRERSKRAEGRWCTEKWQNSSAGTITNRVLAALDALDRHRFDKMDSTNSLDTLYTKVFGGNSDQENSVVKLLCEWAVSPERTGEHRALAVAALLDRRQSDSATNGDQETAPGDDKDSNCSVPGGPPMFQQLLMKFLDSDAPVPAPDDCPQKKTAFSNLVHLFAELIRRDVFSHDAYMCTLISRGDLLGPEETTDVSTSHQSHHTKLEDHSHNMDFDDATIDHDLDKILQNIKEDQQNSMDVPDSPKEHDHGHHPHQSSIGHVPMETDHNDHKVKPSRHLLYTTHFPLYQDDPFSQHDCNQRHVLLYGVGKVRDEARHTVKKMSKEICKLFSKKFSIDVAEGGKVKKHSRNEFNFEATTQKCQSLSYFDQHLVTWQCSVTVIEMLNSFATGNSNYLPVQEHVAFLFDLMELALNIYGLIDVCIQILKELPEVETQLYNKNSVLTRNYTTSLSLYVVGVLRRYHCCLLLSPEQTSAVFEGLCKVVKHVSNPGDCSSAERCILAHLYDLYSSCSLLKSKPHTGEPFGNAYPKIRQALYTALQPTPSSNYVYNSGYMQEVFTNPRRGGRIESSWARPLNESANNRYSFVSNAVIYVCRETDNERLNDLAIMCAEMTACCNSLASEWLGVLLALCCPIAHPGYYTDVLAQLDIQDVSIHNALAVFTCILIARHCFSLEDFVGRVALPSLLKVKTLDNGSGAAEGGMRLTCHLLLRLFRTAEGPQPGLYSVGSPPLTAPRPPLGVRLSCDRHLLAAAHRNIHVGPVLAVLKAVLIVGDATAREGTELSISHILGTSDLMSGGDGPSLDLAVDMEVCGSRTAHRQSSTGNAESTASLSAFACHVLREICSQQWVLERCLSHPEELCDSDNLLDPLLSHSQAQRLLHMICYPDAGTSIEELDQKSMISRILENLEQWTLRMSWLDLQLMFRQFTPNSQELSQWLDTVAKAAIDVFQLNSSSSNSPKSDEKKPEIKNRAQNSIWLVAPLVSKLPSAVQGRVLKVAGQVLESGGWCKETKSKGRGGSDSQSLLSHQPFLTLVLTCLKGQEEGQREGLLSSLHQQLSQLVQLARDGNLQDICNNERTLDGLQLRFALVGGVFEAFQRNPSATTDWALLLVQLVTNGLIDLHTHSELFTTVIDMLATLIHSALATDSQDEGRKMYQNLMKKLKKEVGERHNASLQHVRQLLPLPRSVTEIIAVEPIGWVTDGKGNKISFDSLDKKHGFQVTDKQRVSSWDILEGMKNPAPLFWAWFGAVRLERKPLTGEDNHRLLKYHTHNLQRPPSHYLDPPPLPPEDLEPVPDKPLKDCDLKADTPSSVDQSPAAMGKGRGKGQRRPRKPKTVPGQLPVNPMGMNQPQMGQGQMPMQVPGPNPQMHNMGGYGQGPMPQQGQQYGNNQQQWYNQQQQQQGYYPPQMANVNRFERPQINQSKQALSNLLRSRHPLNMGPTAQTPQGPGPQANYGPMRSFPRQPMRQQHPGAIQQNQVKNMFPQQYGSMQAGMNQLYGNYGGTPNTMMPNNMQASQQMMQGSQPNMFAGQQQGFGQPRPPQPDYRGMAQNPRAQYMQQAPNVTMNANMNTMGGMGGQGGPAPPYSRQTPQGMQQGVQQPNQFQQQRMRQQMMAMQQQQQQQGGPQGNTSSLVAHLQRQMNPNPYQHQPPPYNM